MDALAPMRRRVARTLKRWSEGNVTLTRTTETAPNTGKPWLPGTTSTSTYLLDAVVRGAAEYADGSLVLATDILVVASPLARNEEGAEVDLVPEMDDTITIDNVAKKPKRIEAVPVSGPAAKFRIFVAS